MPALGRDTSETICVLSIKFNLSCSCCDWRTAKIRGDKKKGKATIIKNLGVNKAIEFSYQLADGITEKLKKRYGTRADSLVDSVNFLLRRDH